MNENIIKREDLRQTSVETKKSVKNVNKIVSENSDYIMNSINDSKLKIESKLNSFDKIVSKTEIENTFKELSEDYERLNKFVNESVLYLPKYNLKLCQTLLNSIRTQIDSKKDSLIPKTKFSFKTSFKSNPKNKPLNQTNSESLDVIDGSKPSVDSMPFFGFKDLSDCEKPLRLTSEESNSKDIQLDGLTNCVIEIYGSPNALKINNLLNCRVFCGPITTSIMISNCNQCLFKIASQQLRIHSSFDTDFYIHVRSHPIIEDSKRIRFAPFDWTYDNIVDDFKSAHLDIDCNNWQLIDDFDCLSTDKPSNNWSFIDIE